MSARAEVVMLLKEREAQKKKRLVKSSPTTASPIIY
jgi:hypothetical protein